ncbi:MAG: ATP-binding protein [Deltaproteobacteria bacterium]|nr:ATP-binding protein [Deltaproteobacteria bacterium]
MPFNRKFPFVPAEKGFYIIRGPRQVGKTCWLKTILAHYASTEECFYLSCEEIQDYRELGILLRSIRTCAVILLDEVNFVEGWDRAVKHFIDSGYAGILCVTGSHAYDLEKGADLMPGRFGGGGEFYLLPMVFEEFCEMREQARWHTRNKFQELVSYLQTGGFPTAVASAGERGVPSSKTKQTYLRWLKGDAKKLGKDPEKLSEILIQIYRGMQNPMSYQTLAKKTSIGSPNTVIDYIRLLESSFALRTLYQVDLDSGSNKFRSDKKFYFTDPLIYWIAFDLANKREKDKNLEPVAEMVANEHLARKFSRFGYFRNKQGEIDFISAKHWCLEIKWSLAATNLSKSFVQAIIPQKIVWTQQNFLEEWPMG